MSKIVVGLAGHIDHGKTSLVKALTDVDTDSLKHEKERGMTIDLGFAFLNKNIAIIDVPGHEKFIRNMEAGASNIHVGLIVIATSINSLSKNGTLASTPQAASDLFALRQSY